jgi:hypothetical protein
VIAAPVYPAGNGDFAADRSAVYLAAVMTAHGVSPTEEAGDVTVNP